MPLDPDDLDDVAPAYGAVVTEGRGSLPFALIHGEALAASAAWAMGEAGITLVDASVTWSALADAVGEDDGVVVLHDSLCPLTPPAFLAACVDAARTHKQVVIGFRPVTDTIKRTEAGAVGATLDRDELRAVCSPIVLPARALQALAELPEEPFEQVAAALAAATDIRWEEAPPSARRVASADDVGLLEALDRASDQPLDQA